MEAINNQLTPTPLFFSKAGLQFVAPQAAAVSKLRGGSLKELGISTDQIAEAASYSLAMVVRFALGLSAEGGASTAVLAPNLSGCIAAATIRHLVNAGSISHIYTLSGTTPTSSELSSQFARQIKILNAMGVQAEGLSLKPDSLKRFSESVSRSHNIICGVFDLENPKYESELLSKVNETLNESRTPVHCVDCPTGIDPNSGKPYFTPLFASSTLSLGVPYTGHYFGQAQVGRHYVCDISFTREMYASLKLDVSSLFSEQPVVQIFPLNPEEEK